MSVVSCAELINPELLESTSLITASVPDELAIVLVLAVHVKSVTVPVAASIYAFTVLFCTGFVEDPDIDVSTVTVDKMPCATR